MRWWRACSHPWNPGILRSWDPGMMASTPHIPIYHHVQVIHTISWGWGPIPWCNTTISYYISSHNISYHCISSHHLISRDAGILGSGDDGIQCNDVMMWSWDHGSGGPCIHVATTPNTWYIMGWEHGIYHGSIPRISCNEGMKRG